MMLPPHGAKRLEKSHNVFSGHTTPSEAIWMNVMSMEYIILYRLIVPKWITGVIINDLP